MQNYVKGGRKGQVTYF